MLKVGITGGIGSGKSVVCRVFETLGIPVFDADTAAKYTMEHDETVIHAVKQLFGNEVYENNLPDRKQIASLVFGKPTLLQQLNQIIHPAVLTYGNEWMNKQSAPYTIKEAAIFFESGSYTQMDIMVGVFAPKAIRLQRALQRDGATEEKILQRMANQMAEDEKMSRCDFVINNYGSHAIIPQVLELHRIFLQKANAV